MMYELPPLPYPYDALEPHIDARTMEIHYTKHHGAYVASLNKLLTAYPDLAARNIVEIISDIRVVPEDIRQAVRNHGGGHLNHSLFWQVMGPSRGAEPPGGLAEAIRSGFGGLVNIIRKVAGGGGRFLKSPNCTLALTSSIISSGKVGIP